MALKFKCSKCNRMVVSGYLKRGETMACPLCNGMVIIPESAIETDEPAMIRTAPYIPSEPHRHNTELKLTERDDLSPVCPHCGAVLNEIYMRTKGFPFITADSCVYFCPHCLKVLSIARSRMM
jgi:DNA-directed RNA polymerase subunit RPC12/RpoP